MNRVKDLKDVTLHEDHVLLQIIPEEKKSLIINPNATEGGVDVDYMTIIATGSNVKDVEVGDIVVEMSASKAGYNFINQYAIDREYYAIASYRSLYLCVKPDNFKKGK